MNDTPSPKMRTLVLLTAVSMLGAGFGVPSPLAHRRHNASPPGATKERGACAWCFRWLYVRDAQPRGAEHPATVYVHDLNRPGGPRMRFMWCLGCTEADPLLQRIADNESAPPEDVEAAARTTDLHAELQARIARMDEDGEAGALRAAIYISRDFPACAGLTVRHPDAWGAEVEISKPAFGPSKRTKRDRKKR